MLESARLMLDVCKDAVAIAAYRRMKAANAKVGFYASMPRDLRRKFDKAVHVKQFLSTERDLTVQLTPFFAAQIKSMSKELATLGDTRSVTLIEKDADDAADTIVNLIFNPDDWFARLINIALPTLALGMAQAGKAQLVVLGLAARKSAVKLGDKATTATEWLVDNPGDAEELLVALGGTPSLRILTELPLWMRESIAGELKNTFSQPYWEDISKTTGGDAEKFISQGLEEGWSIRKIANEMSTSFQGSTKSYGVKRATNIARTESGNALNGARAASIDRLASDLGPQVPIRKGWLSVLGNTTRAAHADLDGVPEDVNGMWNLGGTLIPWPSHVALGPENRCNCQCTITTEFGMDEDEARQLIQEHEERRQQAEEPESGSMLLGGEVIDQPVFTEDETGDGRTLRSLRDAVPEEFLRSSKPLLDELAALDAMASDAGDEKADRIRQAFEDYTNKGSEDLNRQLRQGVSVANLQDEHDPQRFTSMAEKLDKYASNEFESPQTVYRGVGTKTASKYLAEIEAGNLPLDDVDLGYGSSSVNPTLASSFAKETLDSSGTPQTVLLQIKTSKGVFIEEVTTQKGELEVLMPRGTRYRFVGVDKDVKIGDSLRPFTILRVEAIHE